jgi:hypothetical protein
MIVGDIHQRQYCCARKGTIMDAAARIRDIVAYAEQTQSAICFLSLFPAGLG